MSNFAALLTSIDILQGISVAPHPKRLKLIRVKGIHIVLPADGPLVANDYDQASTESPMNGSAEVTSRSSPAVTPDVEPGASPLPPHPQTLLPSACSWQMIMLLAG